MQLYRQLSRKRRIWNLRKLAGAARPLKVVLGAGPTRFPGWLQTDKEILDVTLPADWRALFEPGSIDTLLSEHMLEHLSPADARTAIAECYRYLKPGGLFRIAVPDGYRRDPDYVEEASPPKDGHQVLYNVDTLTTLREKAAEHGLVDVEVQALVDLAYPLGWSGSERTTDVIDRALNETPAVGPTICLSPRGPRLDQTRVAALAEVCKRDFGVNA